MSKGLFDDILMGIKNAQNKVSDGRAPLRGSKGDAKLDYVVLSDGSGGYIIDPKRCEEVGIDPEDAANQYIELKTKDIFNELNK